MQQQKRDNKQASASPNNVCHRRDTPPGPVPAICAVKPWPWYLTSSRCWYNDMCCRDCSKQPRLVAVTSTWFKNVNLLGCIKNHCNLVNTIVKKKTFVTNQCPSISAFATAATYDYITKLEFTVSQWKMHNLNASQRSCRNYSRRDK